MRLIVIIAAIICGIGIAVSARAQFSDTPGGGSCTINTADALVSHATDCTGVTAVADVVCIEQDSQDVYVCVPTAGNCDTAGEWELVNVGNSLTSDLSLLADGLSTTGKAATETYTNKTMTAAANAIGADTAVALAANGANCSANSAAGGVDASGAAEDCIAPLLLSGGTLTGAITTKKVVNGAQGLTIADTGVDSIPATDTATEITQPTLRVTCNDDDGCELTLAETNAVNGQQLNVVTMAGTLIMIYSAGISDLCGGVNQDVSTAQFEYVVNTWRQLNCFTAVP